MKHLKEIEENVEQDTISLGKFMKELSKVCREFRASGAMFEEEHTRFINMFVASGSKGASTRNSKYDQGIMEHTVIQNRRAVSGDKSLFRQWHQKSTTALGQVRLV